MWATVRSTRIAEFEQVSLEELMDYIKTIDINLDAIKHLQNTDFVLMFFYKHSHIEADHILQVVQSSVGKLEQLFPKMQFEVIDTDEELELAHHYSVMMHCKIFLKFADTTTLEYPSRIVKELPLMNWIFDNLKNQTENNPRLQEIEASFEDSQSNQEDSEEILSELFPIEIEYGDDSL